LVREADLEDSSGSIIGICEFSSNLEVGVHGARDFISSVGLKCISDNETVVFSFDEKFIDGAICDRSRIVLKRGEVFCCNPLQIFKSSVGTSLYVIIQFYLEKYESKYHHTYDQIIRMLFISFP